MTDPDPDPDPDLYTVESMTRELNEEGADVTEEKVEKLFHDLESRGVAVCVDGEHWDVNPLAAAQFLVSNQGLTTTIRNLRRGEDR